MEASAIPCRSRPCISARMISEEVVRSFLEREVDEVHIIYTQMQNAVVMEAGKYAASSFKED